MLSSDGGAAGHGKVELPGLVSRSRTGRSSDQQAGKLLGLAASAAGGHSEHSAAAATACHVLPAARGGEHVHFIPDPPSPST